MKLAKIALEKKQVSYFAIILILLGGIMSYTQLGQLEDPEFTVKTASIITTYPGASAKQVELEITDKLETKIQEMAELKKIYSNSRAGLSVIKVDIKDEYWADRLPQVWDVLRKKVSDVKGELPPGASEPKVGDDFGYVFGFLVALTADGYSFSELEKNAKFLRKEISVVPNVARVDLWGVQKRRVYIEISESKIAQLGLTPADITNTLQQQNLIVDAGHLDIEANRYRMLATGEFKSPKEIENLVITSRSKLKLSEKSSEQIKKNENELVRIGDIGNVVEGYADPPSNILRQDGLPAIGIAIAPAAGSNVVEVGRAIDKRIEELKAQLPVGINLKVISWQSEIVAESISAFMINLAQAIAIVFVVLALSMGIRMGVIIGVSGLLFPILGTFIIMAIMKIDLQRVSLGAMIIAMGMMVDNAIVVADSFVVRLQQGVDRVQAAIISAAQPAWPLLGATVVACMAFYPIFSSPTDTGEYARSLFTVIAISLLFSWGLSQTITPLLCVNFIPDPDTSKASSSPFDTRFYNLFRGLLRVCIKIRFLFLLGMVSLLAVAIWGFQFAPRMYFPDASRTQFMVDYWLPQGTNIQTTAQDLDRLENIVLNYPEVSGVSAFIGQGPPRFYLPVSPEDNYPSYGQLIINTKSLTDVDTAMQKVQNWVKDNMPQAMVRVRKYGVGAFDDWKFEARFSGPANADPQILRDLAQQGMNILEKSPYAKEIRTNWRNRVQRIDLNYNQNRARRLGITRDNVGEATKRGFDGLKVGLYRENDDMIPIVVRAKEEQRNNIAEQLDILQMLPENYRTSIPLSQVISGIDLRWEDPIIQRWFRRRAITVQASPKDVDASVLMSDVKQAFESIPLPKGYTLEWDGQYDSQLTSTAALVPGIIPAVVVMAFIIVALFNAFRPPLIILTLIPFSFIGITFGLILTQAPFGFIALLGGMSLSGMIIKNAVVLLDQININQDEGMPPYNAVIEAAVSRLRPVMNAAATTVFGMIPLLQDVFWVSMAVTIMFGLAFSTLLTMVLLPVLYATMYKIKANGA